MDVDVAVVGLGVLGAAAFRALALDRVRVLGIDRFEPGHANGSSHGRSRAVRFVYHAPEYVTLLHAAIEGWRALEEEAGRQIYRSCGTLFFARPGNTSFEASVAIMAAGGLPYETLDERAARRRFPAFAITEGAEAVFNPDGGFVDADAAVAAFIAGGRNAGGDIRAPAQVLAIDADGGSARVRTTTGDVKTRHVIVAAGAWTTSLLPDLRLPIEVTRQAWFTMQPRDPAALDPSRVPVWCDYDTMYYGFPDHGPGLKIADDTPGRAVDAENVDRTTDDDEQRALAAYLRARFPNADLGEPEAATCLYTLTPDNDFLLGPVPGSDGRVSLAVGLNHAFKFAPVIGRILADLATTGATPHPIQRFRVDRFAPVAG